MNTIYMVFKNKKDKVDIGVGWTVYGGFIEQTGWS